MRERWIFIGAGIVGLILLRRKKAAVDTTPPLLGNDPVLDAIGGARKPVRDFAQAIALAEGFGVPGAIPTVRHNPGDLVSGGAITTYADDAAGWRALYRQLELIANERSNVYRLDDSLSAMASKWTETEQPSWLHNVVSGLRQLGYDVQADTPLRDLLA